MTGHVVKRSGFWRVVLEFGEQAALRCPTCRRRYWSEDGEARACPAEHGELVELVARRQEMLPAKFTTKKAAEKALHDDLRERERGTWVAPVDLSLGDYLEARWLPSLGAEELSPATVEVYRLHVARIVPQLGAVPLQKLNRNDIAVMAAHLACAIAPTTGRPLSPATRSGLLVTLHRALGDAVEAGLLRTNPAAKVKRPKVRRPEMYTWPAPQLAKFLHATREDRLAPLWHLLALTGLRRGEALGLQWFHVDLEHGRLSIQRQRALGAHYAVDERATKTGKARVVSLDVDTMTVLRRQSRQQLEDADEWGEAWESTGHVFTREDGAPWHPDRVRVLFQQAVKAVDVPRIRMHDLRHTYATMALRNGVRPKAVQERLGRANIPLTMDTYSHVLPDMQESGAELVASVVRAELAALENQLRSQGVQLEYRWPREGPFCWPFRACWSRRAESNRRPAAYKAAALPTELRRLARAAHSARPTSLPSGTGYGNRRRLCRPLAQPRAPVIALKRSTELTGMSSSSAMWNLASSPTGSST